MKCALLFVFVEEKGSSAVGRAYVVRDSRFEYFGGIERRQGAHDEA